MTFSWFNLCLNFLDLTIVTYLTYFFRIKGVKDLANGRDTNSYNQGWEKISNNGGAQHYCTIKKVGGRKSILTCLKKSGGYRPLCPPSLPLILPPLYNDRTTTKIGHFSQYFVLAFTRDFVSTWDSL